MTFKISSVSEYFETLEKRFVQSGAKGVKAVYQYDLGDAGIYHVKVENGGMELNEGAHDKPTTTIIISATDFVGMTNGDLSGPMLHAKRKMKVKGSIPMAMKMKKIFPPAG